MKITKITIGILYVVVLFALVGAFANIMTSFDHNEHMYVTSSVFVAQGLNLYKDFAYLQTPYLPLFYGAIFKFLGITSYYYILCKVISYLFLSLSALSLLLITRRVVKDNVFSLGIVALFLLNMTIVISATEVSNYIIPLALSLISIYIFDLSIDESQFKPFGIVLVGFIAAIAIGVKLTYAPVVIPYFALLLFSPEIRLRITSSSKTVRNTLLLFIIGLALGFLPFLFFMIDMQSFLFNNLGYHNLNTQWRQLTGYSGPMGLLSKIVFAAEIFTKADNLLLLSGILLGFGFSLKHSTNVVLMKKELSPGAITAFFLFLITLVTALVPVPSFIQYYAMPVSFLIVLVVYAWASKSVKISSLRRQIVLILVFVSLAVNGPDMLKVINNLTHRDEWVGLSLHDDSIKMRDALIETGTGTEGKIATLAPLYVTEANLHIYPEFSTGPFLYRSGDYLLADQLSYFRGTSPKRVDKLFSTDPPAAILVGFYSDLERPFLEYAEANNYSKADVAGLIGELYVRP